MKVLDVTRDSNRVYTELYLPENTAGSCPAVIFSHGFTASGRNQIHFAKVFNQAGIALCLFDFCGGGFECRSEGSSLEMSLLTEMEDLRAVFNAVAEEEDIDTDNIFLMGNSQGALVSALLAVELEAQINALILNFPAFSIPETTRSGYPDPDRIPDRSEVFDFPLGSVYHRDAWGINAYERIKRFKKDVLIVHGSLDDVVPLSYSEHAVDTYDNAELFVIDGAGHGYSLEEDRILLEKTLSFIKIHLQKKA